MAADLIWLALGHLSATLWACSLDYDWHLCLTGVRSCNTRCFLICSWFSAATFLTVCRLHIPASPSRDLPDREIDNMDSQKEDGKANPKGRSRHAVRDLPKGKTHGERRKDLSGKQKAGKEFKRERICSRSQDAP